MIQRRKAWTLGGAATGIAAAVAALAQRPRAGDEGAGSPRAQPPVSQDEAKRIRSERLSELKALHYDELARYCDFKLACEVLGRDGVKYAHETYTFYDDRPGGAIRVLVEVWAFDPSALAWTDKLAGGGLWVEPGTEPADAWFDED
jgi:hypothetical protein